jgi:anti-sigma factor ChrR (cupin superfamily)
LDHPSEETLKRFAAGKASREESRTVVVHLLKGCPHCATRLRALMEPQSVASVSYDIALDRFDQGMLEALEASISPVQTLETILRGIVPRERLDLKRRDEE